MTPAHKALLLAACTVLLWSTVASAFKLSLAWMTPAQLVFYACLSSVAVLTLLLAWQRRLHLLLQCSARQYLASAGLGLLNPCLYYLVLFKAYEILPAQEAQPLNYTWALVLAYLSVPLLGTRLTLWDIAAGLICYGGVFIIATRGELGAFQISDPLGVGLALGSTVIWALYWIASTRDRRDPVAGLLLNFLFALPVTAALCALGAGFQVEDVRGLLGAAYIGAFEMGIAFVLWLHAMKLTDNTSAISNMVFLAPFLSLFFINRLVGEQIASSTYAGLALIIAGLVVQRWPRPSPRSATGTRTQGAP